MRTVLVMLLGNMFRGFNLCRRIQCNVPRFVPKLVLAGVLGLILVAPAFAQVQTPQDQADIDRKTMLWVKGHVAHRKSLTLLFSAPAGISLVDRHRTYAAGLIATPGANFPATAPVRMTAGDQRKQDGDNEATAAQPFITQGMNLESQGDAAYAAGNYTGARQFYRQGIGAYSEADQHLEKSVSGYQGAIQMYELAIRP